MRKSVLVAYGSFAFLAAVLLWAEVASAKKVSISGTWSRATILKDCNAAGGICGGCSAKSGGYSCDNLNKGTGVNCTSKGKCTGYVPALGRPPHTLGGILHLPSGANKYLGGNGRPKDHHHPVKIGIKPPKHYRHPVKIGTFKPPYAGNKTDGNGKSLKVMRTSEHHWDERHK